MTTIDHLDAPNPIDRLPPQNTDAEEAVLGSLLMDGSAIHVLRGDLQPGDFYREHNGVLYEHMLALASRGEPVDFITLTDELSRSGQFDEVGGFTYLDRLVGCVPTAVHVEHYAAIVRRCAVKRRGITASGQIARLFYDEELTAEESLTRAIQQLQAIQGPVSDVYSPTQQAEILIGMVEALAEGRPPGIRTGFCRLDWLTGGLRRGCLYVVGAPTGVGKTAWIGSVLLNIAHRYGGKKRQLLASCEVSVAEMVKRFAAAYTGSDWNQLERDLASPDLHPDMPRRVHDAASRMSEHGIHIYHGGTMTAERVRSRATRLAASGGLDVVYVDYLQRMTWDGPRGANREQQVSAMAQGLKTLAVDLDVPVVVAAQFNRATQYREDKQPLLSDFRESGGIENEADVALGLYRPGKWDAAADSTQAWLYVLKNRHGEADCREELVWMPQTTRYASKARRDEPRP